MFSLFIIFVDQFFFLLEWNDDVNRSVRNVFVFLKFYFDGATDGSVAAVAVMAMIAVDDEKCLKSNAIRIVQQKKKLKVKQKNNKLLSR